MSDSEGLGIIEQKEINVNSSDLSEITIPLYPIQYKTITIILPSNKFALDNLNLPFDIIENIEKFLKVTINPEKIVSLMKEIYTNNDSNIMIENLKCLNKYAYDCVYNFETCSRFQKNWEGGLTFGNLFIRLFYTNIRHAKNHKVIIDFMKTNILKEKNMLRKDMVIEYNGFSQLPRKLLEGNPRLIYYLPYESHEMTNVIEALFGIVFARDYFIDNLEQEFKCRDLEFINVNTNTKNSDNDIDVSCYLDLLKFILFDRKFKVTIKNNHHQYKELIISYDDLGYKFKMFNILRLLCFWKSQKLKPYVSRLFNAIEYKDACTDDRNEMRYILGNAITNKSFLLIDTILSCDKFVDWCGYTITKVLIENDIIKIKKLSEFGYGIQRFLSSSRFVFGLVRYGKIGQLVHVIKRKKNLIKELRNENGENILKYSINLLGINHKITKIIVKFNLFDY